MIGHVTITRHSMKILVAGDVNGQLNKLFTRVTSLNKKAGPFDLLLCAGSFFGGASKEFTEQWEQFQNGTRQVPISTLILGPSTSESVDLFTALGLEPSGGELCPNLTYLGTSGVYTTSSSLSIAYLSGVSGTLSSNQSTAHNHCFAKKDVEVLISQSKRADFKGVDVLLTSDWPRGINKHTESVAGGVDSRAFGCIELAYLAFHLKPRYHLCGAHNVFHDRPPYRNDMANGTSVTRFIALANFGNPDKSQKGIYAFNIDPLVTVTKEELGKIPEGSTENPFSEFFGKVKAKPVEEEKSGQQFFFDQSVIDSGNRKRQGQQDNPHGKRPPRSGAPSLPKDLPPGVCWFCLANPKVEKHLIIAIGEHSYLAIPKGGLVPQHVLILPIGHCSSTVQLSPDVLQEMLKFKTALKECFLSLGMQCVIFERNYRTQHLQLQVVPVSKTLAVEHLHSCFVSHGKQSNMEFTLMPSSSRLDQMVQQGRAYFHVEFSDGSALFARVTGSIPLQFGREVLAGESILDIPHRVDWKACSMPFEEEGKIAQAFRSAFGSFDFTKEDGDD